MVTDLELVCRLREVVRCSDLRTATADAIRRRLEEQLAVDLYERRAFSNQQIDISLQSVAPQYDDRETGEMDEKARNVVVENQSACDRDKATSEEKERDNDEIGRRKRSCTVMDAKEKNEVGSCTVMDAKEKNKTGIFRPRVLSPQLQELLGERELAFSKVVKKVWPYIREKNLQDPKYRRRILCNESLHGIFSANSVEVFQMTKELVKHVWPLDETRATRIKSRKKKRGRQILKV